MLHEYRVISVNRFVVTKFIEDDGGKKSSRVICECDNEAHANEIVGSMSRDDANCGAHAAVFHGLLRTKAVTRGN